MVTLHTPDERVDPLDVLHVEVVQAEVPQHLVLADDGVRPPADPRRRLPLGELVDVHPEGGLQAHVHVVGLEALRGVAEQGEIGGPKNDTKDSLTRYGPNRPAADMENLFFDDFWRFFDDFWRFFDDVWRLFVDF